MRFGSTFLVLFTLAVPVFAGPFVDLDLGGTCTKDNSLVIENGDAISILLNDFGVRMPMGEEGDGLQTRKTCWVRLKIKSPKDQYLAGLEQVYRGGLIKSKKASARIVLRYNFAHIDKEREARNYPAGREVRPQDPESEFVQTVEDDLTDAKCGKVTLYATAMVFQAQRPNFNAEFVVGSIDTIDMQLKKRRIELRPRFKKCSDKRDKDKG